MTDYLADVKKYDAGAKDEVVTKIVKHLGIALRNRDSSLVSCTDPKELDRVKAGWIAKKLGVEDAKKADGALEKVCKAMSADNTKNRVTFYYLVANTLWPRNWANSVRSYPIIALTVSTPGRCPALVFRALAVLTGSAFVASDGLGPL